MPPRLTNRPTWMNVQAVAGSPGRAQTGARAGDGARYDAVTHGAPPDVTLRDERTARPTRPPSTSPATARCSSPARAIRAPDTACWPTRAATTTTSSPPRRTPSRTPASTSGTKPSFRADQLSEEPQPRAGERRVAPRQPPGRRAARPGQPRQIDGLVADASPAPRAPAASPASGDGTGRRARRATASRACWWRTGSGPAHRLAPGAGRVSHVAPTAPARRVVHVRPAGTDPDHQVFDQD